MSKSLTIKQSKAIIALASGEDKKAVAQRSGIELRSLNRWLQDENFQRLYNEACQELYKASVASLCEGAQQAVMTLRGIIADPDVPSSTKVRAIDTLLKHASSIDTNQNNLLKAVALLYHQGVIPHETLLSIKSKLSTLESELQMAFSREQDPEVMTDEKAVSLIKSAFLG